MTQEQSSLRILYIDDDAALARLIEKALVRDGHRVTTVTTGDEGLAALEATPFDVVALDHYMPGRDGLEILECIGRRPEWPPVVFVTGTEEGRVAIAALKAGAADYVIKDATGTFVGLLKTALLQAFDRAEARREKERAEAEMRAGRERAEMLLNEVNHRISNSLSLVSTFVRLQRSAVSDEQAREILAETQNRIFAVAQVHRSLYASGDVGAIQMRDYLTQLASELETSLANGEKPHDIVVDAEPVRIPTDKAVPVGIVVTELVTNAFKYAYEPGVEGCIRVLLTDNGNRITLAVEDDGVGISGDAPKGTGLGTKIVHAMAADLGAELLVSSRPGATRTSLSFTP